MATLDLRSGTLENEAGELVEKAKENTKDKGWKNMLRRKRRN